MRYFIGLMSGTSMDGVDAVLCQQSGSDFSTINAVSTEFDNALLRQLHQLCTPGFDEIHIGQQASVALSHHYARAVQLLLENSQLAPQHIAAIGCHGQTVRHAPPGTGTRYPYTLQLGCPATLATQTQIDVVSDFRMKDIALTGQGAPLVPIFHHSVFASEQNRRCIINIGGISNVTVLQGKQPPLGHDTGPGNTLLDQWIQTHHHQPYDDKGQWAASGTINRALLLDLLNDAYFLKPAPKSTGREYFNMEWLNSILQNHNGVGTQDVQATLVELTAQSIAESIEQTAQTDEYFACGGGTYNAYLMERLAHHLGAKRLATTSELGIHPMQVEAAAFAWLANAFVDRKPGNVPAVTGANKPTILGSFTPFA